MHVASNSADPAQQGYLHGKGAAWFAFAMTFLLMIADYVDRQIIVSLFPHLKADWHLTDKQLGSLVSVVSITVALGALPIALLADRTSRVKSVFVMALVWSLATLSCVWARSYEQLLILRAVVGLGEAGYGAVGAALIASHFPARMRGALIAAMFSAASLGSVLGVMLGGVIAERWGWQSAFGIVGLPGLFLAFLYLKVRDYETQHLETAVSSTRASLVAGVRRMALVLVKTRTIVWVCIGGAAQLVVVSALWSWMPSFLNRVHGIEPSMAGRQAALVVLAGAVGSVFWGAVVDRAGMRKLPVVATICVISVITLIAAFSLPLSPKAQMALIMLGGSIATVTLGPTTAIVIEVIHPGMRATGASVLALFQNLFGLAVGPFIGGLLSDAWGIVPALRTTPLFGLLAAVAFLIAMRTYAADRAAILETAAPVAPAAPIPESAHAQGA